VRAAGLPLSEGNLPVSDDFCNCEFAPEMADPEDPGAPSYHYRRECARCGCVWAGLHCPHDGAQNPCPDCGVRPTPVPE
jgi:hypothetical protein